MKGNHSINGGDKLGVCLHKDKKCSMSIIMQNKTEQSNSIKIISKTLTYNPQNAKTAKGAQK